MYISSYYFPLFKESKPRTKSNVPIYKHKDSFFQAHPHQVLPAATKKNGSDCSRYHSFFLIGLRYGRDLIYLVHAVEFMSVERLIQEPPCNNLYATHISGGIRTIRTF